MDKGFDYVGEHDTASVTTSETNHHDQPNHPLSTADHFLDFLQGEEDVNGLGEDKEFGQELKENRLSRTNLEPVIERMNDLAKTQAEMMRVQREMMGVMFSLSMRMDSALTANPGINRPPMRDIKGKGRQIDPKDEGDAVVDFIGGSQMAQGSSNTEHVFETVAFLAERVNEMGKDVGLLLGQVLGTSMDVDIVGMNTQNSRKRRRVDCVEEEPGGSGSSKLSSLVGEPAQQSILNRLGSIELAVYEILEKVKDREGENNGHPREGSREGSDQEPTAAPSPVHPDLVPGDVGPASVEVIAGDSREAPAGAPVPPTPQAPASASGSQGLNNVLGLDPALARPATGVTGPQGTDIARTIGVMAPGVNMPPGLGATQLENQIPNPTVNTPAGTALARGHPLINTTGPPPAYTAQESIPDFIMQSEAYIAHLRNFYQRHGLPFTHPQMALADAATVGLPAIPNPHSFLGTRVLPVQQQHRTTGLGLGARPMGSYERFAQAMSGNANSNVPNGTIRAPGLQLPVGGMQHRPVQHIMHTYRPARPSYLQPHITGGMHAQAGPSNLNVMPTGSHAPHQHNRLFMSSPTLWDDEDDDDIELLGSSPRGPWNF